MPKIFTNFALRFLHEYACLFYFTCVRQPEMVIKWRERMNEQVTV